MKRHLSFQEKLLKFIKKQKKKTLKHALILLPITIAIMFIFNVIYKPDMPVIKKSGNEIVTASFVGDIMLGRNVEQVTKHYGQEYVFKYVEPFFKSSDFVSGNFEHPVINSDNYEGADKLIHLQTTAESVSTLKNMNFSVLSIANNHALDYGQNGLKDTIESFANVGLDIVGAGSNLADATSRISYQDHNGIRIATLGFSDVYGKDFRVSEERGGILPLDPKIFIPMIHEAQKNANLVVVNTHWGQEYNNKANSRQEELAKAMSDAGADIIIGHHPHVLSNIEIYNDTVIFYSLGNFVFDQGWSRTRDSAIVQYMLLENGVGRFEVTPLHIREAQPSPLKSINWLKKQNIFRQLTKGSQNLKWVEEDGKLVFEVNHSDKLKENL